MPLYIFYKMTQKVKNDQKLSFSLRVPLLPSSPISLSLSLSHAILLLSLFQFEKKEREESGETAAGIARRQLRGLPAGPA